MYNSVKTSTSTYPIVRTSSSTHNPIIHEFEVVPCLTGHVTKGTRTIKRINNWGYHIV